MKSTFEKLKETVFFCVIRVGKKVSLLINHLTVYTTKVIMAVTVLENKT